MTAPAVPASRPSRARVPRVTTPFADAPAVRSPTPLIASLFITSLAGSAFGGLAATMLGATFGQQLVAIGWAWLLVGLTAGWASATAARAAVSGAVCLFAGVVSYHALLLNMGTYLDSSQATMWPRFALDVAGWGGAVVVVGVVLGVLGFLTNRAGQHG